MAHWQDRDLGEWFGSERMPPLAPDDFGRGSIRRFGRKNPQRDDDPYRRAMVRSGQDAYSAREAYGGGYNEGGEPVWCFDRFGTSHTVVGDRTVVSIAGEHEDGSDPDFMIYNDVILWDASGEIVIFQYPREDFPPTDFHTATRLWE